jgi:hypothetical protein
MKLFNLTAMRHTPPLAKNTPLDCFVAARLAKTIMGVIPFCLFKKYPPLPMAEK